MTKLRRFIITLLLITLAMSALVVAGNDGKIVGKVTDEKGEPLIGATVFVVGTTRGASTDPDGKYVIIAVPIGTYTIRASQIGYQTTEIRDVKVGADETTQLNIQITSSAVELKPVVISATQELVNKNTTQTQSTFSEKKIEQIPNVTDIQDIVTMTTGAVKQGNNTFLRGGRANEIQYVVDGVPVNSVVGNSGDLVSTGKANQELAQLYAGSNSGAIGGGAGGLALSPNAIQTISVQPSGLDADYGNAQSGIVNITTKSGGENITGSLAYRTDKLANSNQNETYQSFNLGGPEPLSKYLLPGLGIKIPGSLSFFVSADISRSDGANNFIDNEFYHPVTRKIELNGFLGGILNGLGFTYNDNQRNSFTFNSKLKYDISGEDQVSYGYRASLSSGHGYNHTYAYFADSSSLSASLSSQHNLSWTHLFGASSLIKVVLAKLDLRDGNDVAGLKPYEYSSVYQNQDPTSDGFNDLGSNQRWYQSNTSVYTLRFDYNGQIHPLHFLKTGFEFNYEELRSTDIIRPTVSLTDSNGNEIYPPFPDYLGRNRGLYPGYGEYRFVLDNYPNRGAFYVQDNIEFSGLNLHVGIRYDYYDLGRQVYYDDFIDYWYGAVNPSGTSPDAILKPEWVEAQGRDDNGILQNGRFLSDQKRFLYFLTHGNFSPRLAIGYPITDKIVFYFNYGHYLQYADRDAYYKDPFVYRPLNTVGNPDIKPQRTVQYEAGFDDQFSDDMSFHLGAFYKDIFDYSTSVPRGGIYLTRNLDYSSARGFELSLNQSFTGNFSTTVNYSYQIAKGRSSNQNAAIFTPEFQLPRETRLNWDQTHTANVFVTYRVGPRDEPEFFGLPFTNNYGISLTWSFGSGFPYTPVILSRNSVQDQYLVNSETRPYTSIVNLSLYKGLLLFDKINTTVTLDITNLFNRRNVGTGDPNAGFNNLVGSPYVYGDYDPSTLILYTYNRFESRVPPYVFDPPRQIILGLKLSWE